MGPLAPFIKGTLFFLWCFPAVILQLIVMAFTRGPKAYNIPFVWQRGVCKIFGLHVIVEGTPIRDRQTLFVVNHISYLDIPVLGSILKASFVAKKEVATWPVFGFLSRLQQTAFISRSKTDAQREKNALSNMIAEGKSLILFPEGTSTDGRDVVPFKSSLFSMTLENTSQIMIQPVTLKIESIDGQSPDNQAVRDLYAWHDDTGLPQHLKAFTKTGNTLIRLIFHAPINPADFTDRKVLADKCWEMVKSGNQQPVAAGLAA